MGHGFIGVKAIGKKPGQAEWPVRARVPEGVRAFRAPVPGDSGYDGATN